MLATTLNGFCLLAIAASSSAQVTRGDLVEAIVVEDDQLIHDAVTYQLEYFQALRAGIDGGWIARVRYSELQPGSASRDGLIGQRSSDFDAPVELLRVPSVLGGIDQVALLSGVLANGRVAYLAKGPLTSSFGDSVWLDDQLLARRGDPVAGSGGWTWTRFDDVAIASTGRVAAIGQATDPAGAGPFFVVADATGGGLLLNGRDFLPGIPRRIGGLKAPFQFSPNGDHWAAQVEQFFTLAGAMVVDGAVLEVEPGFPVVQGRELPTALTDQVGEAVWTRVESGLSIDDGGRVSFGAGVGSPQLGYRHVFMRGDRVFLVAESSELDPHLLDVSLDGAIAWYDGQFEGRVLTEGHTVMSRIPHADMDGDGFAEPGLFFQDYRSGDVHRGRDGLLVALGYVATATGGPSRVQAIVRARSMRVNQDVCEGLPNSTGYPGRLFASGSPLAEDNELSLQLFDLPTASRGYVLLSRSAGPPTQPAGSQGLVCLGGAIGRLQSGLYLVGPSGRAAVNLDLLALPQPAGSVAVMAGDTWYAQGWHRDTVLGTPTSNFTGAISVDFR